MARSKPKVVRRNGSRYTVVEGNLTLTAEKRVEAITRNLKSGASTKAQKDVVDKVIRPALEQHGTE